MTDSLNFEQHVIDSLARLETNMATLTGSEGRVTVLEKRVLQLIIGTVVLAVLALGPAVAITLLK